MANERQYSPPEQTELQQTNPVELITKNEDFPWVVAVDTTDNNHFLYHSAVRRPDFNFNMAIVKNPQFLSTVVEQHQTAAIIFEHQTDQLTVRELSGLAPVIVLHSDEKASPEQISNFSNQGAHSVRGRDLTPGILAATVRSIDGRKISSGGIELNLTSGKTSVDGEPVNLGVRELQLVEYFIRNPNVPLSTETLTNTGTGEEATLHRRRITINRVASIRRKLPSDLFESKKGIGYTFNPQKRNK